jgi:hypothetical protein
MLWPTLLFVDLVAFRTPRPVVILLGFLVGGLITTVAIGCLLVYALRGTELVERSRDSSDAWVDIVLGLAAIAAAQLIAGRARTRVRTKPDPGKPSKWSGRLERAVSRGALLAFGAGVVLNIAPGILPFIALKKIADLDYGRSATFTVIVVFYIVMFTLVEVPAACFAIAPERTKLRVSALNTWLDENRTAVVVWTLMVFGVFELVHGVVIALQ